MADLTGYSGGLAFLPFDDEWRRSRKMIDEGMNTQVIHSIRPMQDRHAYKFAKRLAEYPGHLHECARRYVTAVILEFSIGYQVKADDDILATLAGKVSKNTSHILAHGQYWIDMIPLLRRYLPVRLMGSRIYKTVHTFRRDMAELIECVEQHIRGNRKGHNPEHAFIATLLQEPKMEAHKGAIHYLNASMYAGGIDSITSILQMFYLLMILHPEVQEKAQEEIDRVVGQDRLPTQDDRAALPYVEAILKEILRWNSPTPLTSRLLERDRDYEGHLLPSGATVVVHLWSMTHDDAIFSDPHTFNPDRYMSDGAGTEDNAMNSYSLVFGFGRRKCPGAKFAISTLWIAIATSLATMKVSAPIGPDGKRTVPAFQCEDGNLVKIIPYDYHLEPRNEAAVELLTETHVD